METKLKEVTILFAGDSGDGIQLAGGQFTNTAAQLGNDVSTFPDFPAEIRAPAGTLPGVSGFQIQFGETEILTPGDAPNCLVAMNPKNHKKMLANPIQKHRMRICAVDSKVNAVDVIWLFILQPFPRLRVSAYRFS